VLAERGQPAVADTDDPPPPEVGATEILDVLRSAAASGLTMVELEQRLPGPRSRLRRILGQLEADGAVSREGATRWTRYRIAGPRAEDREPNSAAPAGEPPRPTAPLRRRAVDRSPAIRTVYYKGAHSADAQTVATIVLHRGAVEIEYAPGQPRLHALERIATPDGVVTPQDGRRFWAALPSAFATNLRFFLAEGGTLASERADAGPQTVRASDEPGVRSSGEADPIGREPRR
jgi:hypothetical protein